MKTISASLIALLTILISGNLMATEEAEYSVSLKEDQFEIREYAPSIVAEVIVYADFEDASNDAFRSLFKSCNIKL